MTKQYILDEIRRTAKANHQVPLGHRKFLTETGIKTTDWQGKFWVRWGDAIREAGLTPNQMTEAYEDRELISKLALFIRELGHYPVKFDFRMKSRREADFPSDRTFGRLGTKGQIAAKILAYCRDQQGFEDVSNICALLATDSPTEVPPAPEDTACVGYVYLIKAGRYYKIGKSNAVGRREREIALQLPEESSTVHSIKTDDPSGIEAYWHRRFAAKRKNGEWFALEASDIAAFRRRKFM